MLPSVPAFRAGHVWEKGCSFPSSSATATATTTTTCLTLLSGVRRKRLLCPRVGIGTGTLDAATSSTSTPSTTLLFRASVAGCLFSRVVVVQFDVIFEQVFRGIGLLRHLRAEIPADLSVKFFCNMLFLSSRLENAETAETAENAETVETAETAETVLRLQRLRLLRREHYLSRSRCSRCSAKVFFVSPFFVSRCLFESS